MNRKRADKDSKFYLSIFLSFILSIVLTIFALSSILYVNFESIALKQIYTNTLNNLKQTSQSASIMSLSCVSFAKQIYNDKIISRIMTFPTSDVIQISEALNQMNNYCDTTPFIDSVYVYNSANKTFYISNSDFGEQVQNEKDLPDKQAVEIVNNFSKYPTLMPIPRAIPVYNAGRYQMETQRLCYSFLIYDTLTRSKQTNMVVVNVSVMLLHKSIDGMITNSDSNTFIIDNSGKLISNSWKYPMLSDLSNKNYIQDILKCNNSPGYFVGNVDGVKSLISFTEQDSLGWTYIRIVPYSVVVSSITNLKIKTVIIGLSILIFGLLISFMISRKLYKNIVPKLLKLRVLELERRNSIQPLRQEYIRKFLLGSGGNDAIKIREDFTDLQIEMDIDSRFIVLLFKIDYFKEFTNQYNNDDKSLIKFGILNITDEIIAKDNKLVSLDMGEDNLAVLIDIQNQTSDHNEILEGMVKQVQEYVKQYFTISLTAIISPAGSGVGSLNHLYNQVIEASFHRLFRCPGCIIYSEQIENMKEAVYTYPVQKEKQLIEELMLGKYESVKVIFKEIIEDTSEYSYRVFKLAISRLALSIDNALHTIQKNNSELSDLNINTFLRFVDDVEFIDEVYFYFFEKLDMIIVKQNDKKKTKYDDIVNNIIDIINQNYMDQTFCIDVIADSLNISSQYLGNIFKKHTLKTILEYISEVRMNKARELLEDKEFSIAEISERVGYTSSSYFYKAFKREHGITPADYRKSARKDCL